MKILVFDIFNDYRDFYNKFKETIVHIYGKTFIINDDNVDIGEKIHKIIMKNKGDGVNTEIHTLENIIYMKVFLLFPKASETIEQYDIDYLISYLEKTYHTTTDRVMNNNLDKYKNLILIKSDDIDKDCMDELIKELKLIGLDCKIYTKNESLHDCGASSFFTDIIIGLCKDICIDLFIEMLKAIINKIKQNRENKNYIYDYIIFGEFDKNKLLLNFAREINDPNINKYHISAFDKMKNGNYSVCIEKRDVMYDVICNKNAEILNYNTKYII